MLRRRRHQLDALACNLAHFLGTLASLREGRALVADDTAREAGQIGARIVRHGR
jgi:hypothetical protein